MRDPNYSPRAVSRPSGKPAELILRGAAVAFFVLILTACSHTHADLSKPQTQGSFGVQMAKMNLWREAMFRFQRAVELNPANAMAHNNLAVACEANGEFDKAAKEYSEALRLDRQNQYIQKNYSRYTEFMARNKKRQQRQEAKEGAKSSTAPPSQTPATQTPPATTPPPPNPPPQNPPANPPGEHR